MAAGLKSSAHWVSMSDVESISPAPSVVDEIGSGSMIKTDAEHGFAIDVKSERVTGSHF